jgi:hypothetical protein
VLSTAVARSDPTEVQLPTQPAVPSNASLTANVVHVATPAGDRSVLRVVNGVSVYGSGYGSAIAFAPNGSRDFFLLTDRGPNVDATGGNKIFPVPDYNPRIVKGHMSGDKLTIDGEVVLRRANGTRICSRSWHSLPREQYRQVLVTPGPEDSDRPGVHRYRLRGPSHPPRRMPQWESVPSVWC